MTRQTIRFSAAATALAIALGFAAPAPAQQAGPALTLEAAERAFGLGQASDQLDYETRRASADRITYQDVALNDLVQADRMTLRVVEGDGGRREAVVRLEGARLAGFDGFSLRAIELTGIDPRLIGPELFDFSALMSGEIEIAGDLQLEGLEFRLADDAPPMRLARLRLDNIDTTEGYASFDAFELNGFSYRPSDGEMSLDTIRISGISDAVFSLASSLDPGDDLDWSALTVDEFTIKGVTVTGFTGLSGLLADLQEDPRAGARKALASAGDWLVALRDGEPLTQLAMLAQPSDDGTDADPKEAAGTSGFSVDFRLGEFTLRNIGLMERLDFVMKGVSSSYTMGDDRGRLSFDEISFDDLNMPILAAYYGSDFVPLPDAQMQRSIASFVPEGPSGMSLTAFAMRGISFETTGIAVRLDRWVVEPVRNDDGKIVAMQIPSGQLTIQDKSEDGELREAIGMFGVEELTLSLLPTRYTWDPATDMLHQEPIRLSMPNLASATFELKAHGYQAWMNQTTLADIQGAQARAVEAMADSVGEPQISGIAGSFLANWITGLDLDVDVFEGVSLHDANFLVEDLGILAAIARGIGEDENKTPEEARVSMAAPFASIAADKSKPVWERLFSNAARGFIAEGGTLNFRTTPVPPLPFRQLGAADLDPARLGVQINHVPAAPAGRAN